jgi:hypothetical protein
MKRRILILILLVTGIAVWYAYSEYHRTNPSLSETDATVTVTATSLLAAFEQDSAKAIKQYNNQVIAVTGLVKKIEAEDNPVVIFLGDAGQLSSVQCSMDSSNVEQYKTLQKGMTTTIKGQVAGFRSDPLFGTDVVLNRCVIANKP